jgi:hypothetical protein
MELPSPASSVGLRRGLVSNGGHSALALRTCDDEAGLETAISPSNLPAGKHAHCCVTVVEIRVQTWKAWRMARSWVITDEARVRPARSPMTNGSLCDL